MLPVKAKKITLPLCLCAISVLFTPTIVLAATSTGDIAAIRAAEQKAALAKKAAEREAKKKEAEAKKATEIQMPAEEQKSDDAQKAVGEPKEK